MKSRNVKNIFRLFCEQYFYYSVIQAEIKVNKISIIKNNQQNGKSNI